MRWVVLALAVLVGMALGAGGALLVEKWRAPPAEAPGTPGERLFGLSSFMKERRPGAPPKAVAALGRLQPRGEIIDLGGLMGDRLGKLEVHEGDEVKKDAVLGYLDSYSERQAERNVFAAQLDEAKARLAAETSYANTQIKEAEIGIQSATELDPLDIKAQRAKVRLLETEVATAETDLERIKSVTTPGAISPQKRDQQTQLVRRFREELAAARATLAKAEAGQKLQLERTRAQLAGAQAGLARVQSSSQVESLTRSLALADARLERTVLRAPEAGRILAILCQPGERVDQKPILRLADTSVMYAVAEVYETDIRYVKVGQKARVRSPALGDRELSGTTERIGWSVAKNQVLSIDPAASADARVVKVWIRLDSAPDVERLTDLQVDVVIEVDGAAKETA